MKIFVTVQTRSRKNEVEKVDAENYIIYTSQVPEKGKANKEVIAMLAEYFNVTQSEVEIVRGSNINKKIIDINK